MKPEATPPGPPFGRRELLRWLYLGRITLVAGIFAGAIWKWFDAPVGVTFVATVLFVTSVAMTSVSFWYTHVLGRSPAENFAYAHVAFDVLLVTAIVHITEGQNSVFAPLYVLVVSEGALLLPLSGGVLIGALASIVYFADIFWFYGASIQGTVAYQIVLFSAVALITGVVGDRLRRAGIALGAVQSELQQLKLDTGDILASIRTGVLTVDGAGRLAYMNPAAESILGMDAASWLGAPVLTTVDQVVPGLGMVLRRSLEDGLAVTRFRTTTHQGPRPIPLDVSTTVVPRREESPTTATALLQDVGELERIEALNRRTARLEAVAELSASLAHEIKNPLASIRSAVEQISTPQLGSADRQHLQRLVVTESDRLSRLLSDFIDFSSLTMSRRDRIEVGTLVRDCVALVRQHPDRPDNVEIDVEELGGSLEVVGDTDLLHRAVFNLVLNAAQFSSSGDRVSVRIEERSGSGLDPGSRVRLSVRDHGPGVSSEEAARIFDPFFTRRPGGSGLGLAVVHRAVEAHQGSVLLEEPEGGGAEFVIDLPRAAVAEAIVP